MSEPRKLTLNLLCPSLSLSKMVQFVTWDDQSIDLGSISRTFGINPQTIKLNGHFISRGVDLIASSVTWKTLLSFFSARGRSTGTTTSDPLIVDGKLCTVGSKRAHSPSYAENIVHCTTEQENRKPPLEDCNLFKKLRFRDSEFDEEENNRKTCMETGHKRKQYLGSVSPRKKTRMYEVNLGLETRETTIFATLPVMQFSCSLVGENMKRIREEDELAVSDPCKKKIR